MSVDTSLPTFSVKLRAAIDESSALGAKMLPEIVGKQILRHYGIVVPRGGLLGADFTAPEGLSAPYVLKAVAPTLVHKSEAGAVRLGLEEHELASVAAQMHQDVERLGHVVSGFLVEEQAASGQEIIVGAVRNARVGWTLMVGLGGIFVEVLGDVAFGLAPVDRDQIAQMLEELAGKAILNGVRGAAPADLDGLIDAILAFAGPGGLLADMPDDICEIDLNPIIVSADSAVAVDARFVIGTPVAPTVATPHIGADFTKLLAPEVVAVLGASTKGDNGANLFIRNLQRSGFTGQIIPVHPSGASIAGLDTVPSLADVTTTVDYAYVALPAGRVADALAAGAGKVRFAQVISSGFGETREGADLERELVAATRAAGMRLIGPNCLGTHSPQARMSFVPDVPGAPGGVAVVSQSGGLSVDILRLGAARGIEFRTVISMGNGADVTAAELVAFLLDDPDTSVIGLYLESLADGRAVLDVLSARPSRKPVVLLAGGRTADGSRAATSHTGALSGNHRLWPALARQAGAVLVDNMKQFLDALLVFELSRDDVDASTGEIILFGNGGGASVLAADAVQRVGLTTPTLPAAAIDELNGLGLPPGNGLLNPIDTPATTLLIERGAVAEPILDVVLEHTTPVAVISHFNVGILYRNLPPGSGDVTAGLIDAIARSRSTSTHPCHHLLVLKTDGTAETNAQIALYRHQAHTLGIPSFEEIEDAAAAALFLVQHQRRRIRRGDVVVAGRDR